MLKGIKTIFICFDILNNKPYPLKEPTSKGMFETMMHVRKFEESKFIKNVKKERA